MLSGWVLCGATGSATASGRWELGFERLREGLRDQHDLLDHRNHIQRHRNRDVHRTMAVLNKRHNYLFLSEPHIASRSIQKSLITHAGSEAIGQHDTLDKLAIDSEGLRIFSCIRHPCDWLVTRYMHLDSWHRLGFTAFLNDFIKGVQQSRTIFLHAKSSERLIRYEHLTEDLKQLELDWRLPQIRLEHIGKTAHKGRWQKYYDAESYRKVTKWLHDFATYGYMVPEFKLPC